ncbi:MAG TPA: acyl-CoA dehydratase activase-related protein [Clostridia bacterium]
MTKKLGIPRALFFYKYYPLWKSFFEGLGVEVIPSDSTCRKIVNDGSLSCVGEACLPIKVFFGHVENLLGRVDYIFIPRFISISKNEYICPEIAGLPDMIKESMEGIPDIISPEINLRKSRRGIKKAFYDSASYFCKDSKIIKSAYREAIKNYRNYRLKVKNGYIPVWNFPADTDEIPLKKLAEDDENTVKIGIIGHEYNLYDGYLNLNILDKLEKRNIQVLTLEVLEENDITSLASTLPKRMFWNFGRKAVGGTLKLIEDGVVDGIIYIMSFGCGIDSFVCDIVRRKVTGHGIPFAVLSFDAHSGDAGFDTRLEAFLDIIGRGSADDTDLSAFG